MIDPGPTTRLTAAYADRKFRSHLLGIARRCAGASDPEDIVQDAFTEATRQNGSINNIRGWLVQTVRALATKQAAEDDERQAAEVRLDDPKTPELPTPEVDPSPYSPAVRRALRSALGSLPRADRELLNALYWEEESVRMASQHLRVPVMTLWDRHRRILEQLSRALAVRGGKAPRDLSLPVEDLEDEAPFYGWLKGKRGGWGAPTWTCGFCGVSLAVSTRRCVHTANVVAEKLEVA